jgi:hypothetical protein
VHTNGSKKDLKSSGGAFAAGAVVDFAAMMAAGHIPWVAQNQLLASLLIGAAELPVGHLLRRVQNGAGLGVCGLAGGRVAEALLMYMAQQQAQQPAPQAQGLGQGWNPRSFSANAGRALREMNAGRSLSKVAPPRVAVRA